MASGTRHKHAVNRARERRRALDADRDAREQRIDEAVAAVLIEVDQLRAAEHGLHDARAAVAAALRALIGEGLSADRAAALCDLPASDVRRLTRAPVTHPSAAGDGTADERSATVTSLTNVGAGSGADRRAG